MSFKSAPIPSDLQCTNDFVSGELRRINKAVFDEMGQWSHMQELMERHQRADAAMTRLREQVASSMGIKPDKIITIFNGAVFYN